MLSYSACNLNLTIKCVHLSHLENNLLNNLYQDLDAFQKEVKEALAKRDAAPEKATAA
jgi:hypothetical protein